MNIAATRVFDKTRKADSRLVINQGGTRSSKTYSIAQYFAVKLAAERNKRLTVTRKTTPSMKQSVMRDWEEVITSLGFNVDTIKNKTDSTYNYLGNLVEFVSMDAPQKKRGAKRDYLWMNEMNEFTYEDYRQLTMRTKDQIHGDYNPSDEFHWIYEKVLPRDDCTFIQSTYLDNPFLEQSLINEIERLKEEDEDYWRVYGLGERGVSREIIYTNWQILNNGLVYPDSYDVKIYGLDFGFNNPTALIEIRIKDQVPYLRQRIYETRLTNQDLIDRLDQESIEKNVTIFCDSAEPDRIEEIKRAGWFAVPSNKSVEDGIDYCRRLKLMVDKNSSDVIKEFKYYKYKLDKEGNTAEGPVKFNDHAMDAIRYALYTYYLQTQYQPKVRFIEW